MPNITHHYTALSVLLYYTSHSAGLWRKKCNGHTAMSRFPQPHM